MARQRFSSMGVVSSMLALSCASVLGIEDATCDPEFDPSCASTITESNLPAPPSGLGGGDARAAAGSSGAAGVGAANGSPGGSGGAAAGAAGAAGNAGGAANAGAGGSGEPAELAPLCDRYCETVATACTGNNEQYASLDACLAVCAQLEPGSPGETGNTVECRLARAQLAQRTGEAANYCYSAGPGGADACGNDCEGFCTLMAQTCPAAMGTYADCLPQCQEVPNLEGPPNNVTYNTTVQEGNSVQCRLFHVTAASLDPIAHCVHAAGLAPCAAPVAGSDDPAP